MVIFGTLERLVKMGYTGVEFAGYNNISAKEMKEKLDLLHLTALSAHVGIDLLLNNLEQEIAYLLEIGAKYLVCPGAPINTIASALEYAEYFNKIGKQCKDAGLTFAYHNHDFEFKLDQGQYPLEVLFEHVNSEYVKQQPDVFWIAYAGLDVKVYLQEHQARIPILHLKQLENNESKKNVDAGSGIIDFQYIIELMPNVDFVYEQEEFVGTVLDNIQKSYDFISRLF